jgi:hypothetical protein
LRTPKQTRCRRAALPDTRVCDLHDDRCRWRRGERYWMGGDHPVEPMHVGGTEHAVLYLLITLSA